MRKQPLVVDQVPLSPQQDVQPPIAEASSFMGDRLHPLAQSRIIDPDGLVAHRHPTTAQHPARPPLAHSKDLLEMGDSIPLDGGRYHFFPSRSFSAELSSIASARQPLELGILVLERPQLPGFADVHPAILRLPLVDAGIAHAMLPAQVGDRNPRLVLFQKSR